MDLSLLCVAGDYDTYTNNNNNRYSERITCTGPKRLHKIISEGSARLGLELGGTATLNNLNLTLIDDLFSSRTYGQEINLCPCPHHCCSMISF